MKRDLDSLKKKFKAELRKKVRYLVILAISLILAYFGIDFPVKEGQHKVVKVVDGDTLVLSIDEVDERVRLIGIDTPESVHPDSNKNVEEGKIASDYMKKLVDGKYVEIEYDSQKRDRYNRILAYIYIDGDMVNKIMLREGYARLATYPPNVKYVDDFIEIEKEAQRQKKGFWKSGFYSKSGDIIIAAFITRAEPNLCL